jgi:uncharacterized protein
MTLIEKLQNKTRAGRILGVQIGLFWTAVLAETDGGLSCGLAATLTSPELEHDRKPAVGAAGHLHELSSQELMALAQSSSYTEASIGIAAINTLLPKDPRQWVELNAEDYIVQHGAARNVAVVGHFPFILRLKPQVKNLWVLELRPRGEDLPAEAAPDILPQADLVAITATTLINGTFEGLMALCRPDTRVMLLGPSTPLSPVLFDAGVDVLSGTIVDDPPRVLQAISQGITFLQLHHLGGVRLVTMQRPAER